MTAMLNETLPEIEAEVVRTVKAGSSAVGDYTPGKFLPLFLFELKRYIDHEIIASNTDIADSDITPELVISYLVENGEISVKGPFVYSSE